MGTSDQSDRRTAHNSEKRLFSWGEGGEGQVLDKNYSGPVLEEVIETGRPMRVIPESGFCNALLE